ncbi:MAG: ParB/RepB/Spo0J family partition protein [Legionellaceae bacterium]|nr:ParB/RepB/Spo0J family partition protein [Legionellaceae bacterium]
MAVKRGGLGRNLSALLSAPLEPASSNMQDFIRVPLSQLERGPYQPRTVIEDAALQELSQSIQQQGLLQPIVVRRKQQDPERYEIIAGERRWRACQLAGLKEVPICIQTVDDKTAMAMALVENLQRENLSILDQANAMQQLAEAAQLTHQALADLLGKSRTAVSNILRLLQLSAPVLQLLADGQLEMGHARALLSLSAAEQAQAANMIVDKHLSAREAENLVTRMKEAPENTPSRAPLSSALEDCIHILKQHLHTKVRIQSKGKRGTLLIHYQDERHLQHLVDQFSRVPHPVPEVEEA